jgi:hypothetical protein
VNSIDILWDFSPFELSRDLSEYSESAEEGILLSDIELPCIVPEKDAQLSYDAD